MGSVIRMSEKQFRPHLDSNEILFLLEVVKYAEGYLDSLETEYKQLEIELYRLRCEVRKGNTMIWKELRAVKEQLEEVKNLPLWLVRQRIMLQYLKRRFQNILNGGKPHRHDFYVHSLDHALPKDVVPKTL